MTLLVTVGALELGPLPALIAQVRIQCVLSQVGFRTLRTREHIFPGRFVFRTTCGSFVRNQVEQIATCGAFVRYQVEKIGAGRLNGREAHEIGGLVQILEVFQVESGQVDV
jgi:hypothetical protein